MHRLAYTNIIKVFTRKHLGSVALKDVVAWGGVGGGEHERARGSSFYMFSSPWACPMQIGLSQECCST